MSDEYVDIQAGMKLLGETQHKFFYHVDRHEIAIKPGTERKSRRYKVSDILAVKERLKTKKRKPTPVLIDWITAADVPAGLTLAQRLYGPDVDLADLAVYQSWRKHNTQISLGAFSPDRSQCYASIQIVPLPESVILDVVSCKREENSIQPDEIRGYDEPGPYTLLATSALCLPDRPDLLYRLLYRYMDYWIEMYPERYMQRVYAQAVSERGMMLVQHFFLAPRPDLAYNAFMLDMSWPVASKFVQRFKAQLQEKAPLPPALQWPPETPPERQHTPVLQRTAPQHIEQERPRTTVSEMPEGLIGLAEYARQCGIPPTTLKKAAEAGRVPVVRGHWKVGRAIVQEALDATGRARVQELYPQRQEPTLFDEHD